MLLQLDADLEMFRDTTERFLGEFASVEEIRRLRDHDAGFDPDYWRRGAELGWVSLLVDEAHGGGSVSGNRLVDLSVLAHEFGRRAAPGPLITTNIVASALSAHDADPELLAQLLCGESVATWAHAEGATPGAFDDLTLDITLDGQSLVLNGQKRPVESARVASHLLVTGLAVGGPSQVLVPADCPGVSVTPMEGVDLTRRFSVVTFDNVSVPVSAAVGELGGAATAIDRQLQYALIMANAEAVGAMQTGFDMTLEWALDRYSFGRPLASYQAIKHRFADMATWLETAHALSDEATAAAGAGSPDADELLSAAKAFIGDYGAELLQECVQFHGGIGLTFEHDLHLSLRRHTVDRALFGTPADHRRRVAEISIEREAAS